MNRETIAADPANTASTPLGQVSYEVQGGMISTTGLDLVGNRKSRDVSTADLQSAGITDFTDNRFDARDRLETGATYDANGNTLRGATTAAGVGLPAPTVDADDQYDFENRLTNRISGERSIFITYDGDGNRVRKIISDVETQMVLSEIYYVVDDRNPTGYAQVIEERTPRLEPNNTYGYQPLHLYIYGHKLISQDARATPEQQFSTYWYGFDGHGSVRLLSDSSGQTTDTYTYDSFGILIDEFHPPQPTPNKYLYACEQFDADLGHYYNRDRLFNPQTGRFWTTDRFEGNQNDPLSLHKYLYCHADPVNRIDPSGMWSLGELNFTTAQMLVLAAKAANVGFNSYFGAKNVIDGVAGLHRGDTFTGSLQIFMGALNLGAAFLSALGPLPPPPPAAAVAVAGASGPQAAIAILSSNPALREWFLTHVLPQLASSAAAATGYAINSVADGENSGNRNSDPPNNHHPIAKFLGGDAQQELANIPQSIHREYHSLLRQLLNDAGFPLPIGGVTGSSRRWAEHFARNPGSQERALVQVLQASRVIDQKHGTTITQKVWDNLVNYRYTPIP